MNIKENLWPNLFRNAFTHSAIGMALVGLDGRWLDVNPSLCQIVGYTKEELLELAIHNITHPDDLNSNLKIIDRLRTGEINKLDYEKRYVRKNGTTVWVLVTASLARDERDAPFFFIAQIVDISQKKQNEILLKRTSRALETRSAVNAEMIHATDETSLLIAACRIIVDVGGYRMAWFGKPQNDEQKTVEAVAWYGDTEAHVSETHVTWSDSDLGHGPTGLSIQTGMPQVVQNFAHHTAMEPWRERALERGYHSGIALPLKAQDKIFGSLTIYARESDAFDLEEVKLLQQLADDLAFGVAALRLQTERNRIVHEHSRQAEQLHQSLIDSIQAIATMVELRDPYTAGHEARVANLAAAIAHELGLDRERIEGIKLASLIHDVGKIKVPAEILNKPGRLSAIEFELIKLHPQSGYEVLKDIQFPWPIARIVYEHHERVDGTGYPRGLRGDEILLDSKILAVADVVESMQSHRPYRPGLGIETALAEISQHRGVWFDAVVCDACLRLFREGRYSL
ncbi:PAS domain S-box protein [Oxalobacteraceae bacterium R-40]|uniref:PAS domain S-box protein n=1 Tax=Keguizhuia sedimenti TaxID=3064264 RepID=A0ABU1BLK1_9BURK|nr:PAS domain S-box protein [Oxalobacteraceae bacterium R-40]